MNETRPTVVTLYHHSSSRIVETPGPAWFPYAFGAFLSLAPLQSRSLCGSSGLPAAR
jgi:hypothetical protein